MTSLPQTFSPSAAAVWKQCPKRWWFKYIDRLPEPPPGEPAILGTFVHAILEELLGLPAPERTAEAARAIARQVWPSIAESEDWLSLGLDDAAALRFRQRAWRTVEAYFTVVQPSEVEPLGREISVTVDIDGVPFHGFIDLVERDPITNDVMVTDYKTGKPPSDGKPWSAGQNEEKLLQPLWYAEALRRLGDYEPSVARLLYFNAVESRDGQSLSARTGRLSVVTDADALGRASSELRKRWEETREAAELGHAQAKPSALCGWCPFVEMCAEGTVEVERRWNDINPYTMERRMPADAPAVAVLGLT